MKRLYKYFACCLVLLLASCGNNNSSNVNNSDNINDSTKEPTIVIEDEKRVVEITNDNASDFFDVSFDFTTKYEDGCYYSYLSTNLYPDGSTSVATTNAKFTLTPLKTGFVYYEGSVDVYFNFSNPIYKHGGGYNSGFSKTDEGNYSNITEKVTFTFDGHKKFSEEKTTYTGTYKWSTKYSYREYYSYAYSPNNILNKFSELESFTFKNSDLKATYIDSGLSGDENLKYQSIQITEHNFSTYFKIDETLTTETDKSVTKTIKITPIISTISDASLIDYNNIVFTSYDSNNGTLRRDGTFTKTIKNYSGDTNFQIKTATGSIEIYPGSVV